MKSGYTTILLLGTIGLGLYCCGQVFLSEDQNVTVSAPVDWQFVNASLKGDQSTQNGIDGFPDSSTNLKQVALDSPFRPPGQQSPESNGHHAGFAGSEVAGNNSQRVTALPNVEPLSSDEITGETITNPFFESDSPNYRPQDQTQLAELYRETGTSSLPEVDSELEITNPYYSGKQADIGSQLAHSNQTSSNSSELEIANPYYSVDSTGTGSQLAVSNQKYGNTTEAVSRSEITNPYFSADSASTDPQLTESSQENGSAAEMSGGLEISNPYFVAEAVPATPQVESTSPNAAIASKTMPETNSPMDNGTEKLASAPVVPALDEPGTFRAAPNMAPDAPNMARVPKPAPAARELAAPASTILHAPQPMANELLTDAANPVLRPDSESTGSLSPLDVVDEPPRVTATTVRTASAVRTVTSEVDPLPNMATSSVVEQRAREHIQYGQSLARRGAVFAARQEFIQALRLIADSHDMNGGSRDYTLKLATALRVLGESDDFIAADSEQQLEMNLESILETHTAKLIPPAQAHRVTPIKAMQIYYEFATGEMAQSVGQSIVASEALHSLGKLLTTSAQSDANGKPLDNAKAMVMHQVALSADPHNFKSANELGVLMAQNGRWKQAHDLFTKSLRSKKTPETWRNLAGVHQQLARIAADPQTRADQHDLAALAHREFEMMMRDGVYTQPGAPMQWVSPEDFDERAAMPEVQAQPSNRTAQTPRVETPPKRRGLFGKAKDWF